MRIAKFAIAIDRETGPENVVHVDANNKVSLTFFQRGEFMLGQKLGWKKHQEHKNNAHHEIQWSLPVIVQQPADWLAEEKSVVIALPFDCHEMRQ